MAKLSARGRTVLAQVRQFSPLEDGRQARTELVLCSDGAILIKRTMLKADGRVDYGDSWKSYRRLKPTLSPYDYAERWQAKYTEAGWEVVKP